MPCRDCAAMNSQPCDSCREIGAAREIGSQSNLTANLGATACADSMGEKQRAEWL